MEMDCPYCGFRVDGDAGEFPAGPERCPRCKRRSTPVSKEQWPSDESGPRRWRPGAPPPGVQAEELDGGARFSLRWWRWDAALLLPPLGLGLLWAGWGLASLLFKTVGPAVASLVALTCGAGGLLLLYLGFCYWMNRTCIEITAGGLAIGPQPLPWRGRRELARAQLERLYCRSDHAEDEPPTYDLVVVLKDGLRTELVHGLRSSETARYLLDELQCGLGLRAPAREPGPRRRPPVACPASIRRVTDGAALHLKIRWFAPRLWWFALFVLAWNGAVIAEIGFGPGYRQAGAVKYFLLVVPPLLGVGLFYCLMCVLVNRTIITVTKDHIRVRHGPLPLLRGSDSANAGVEQFYYVDRFYYSGDYTPRTYEVCAVFQGDWTRSIVTGLNTPAEALFIEQEIEKHLCITDQAVQQEKDGYEFFEED